MPAYAGKPGGRMAATRMRQPGRKAPRRERQPRLAPTVVDKKTPDALGCDCTYSERSIIEHSVSALDLSCCGGESSTFKICTTPSSTSIA